MVDQFRSTACHWLLLRLAGWVPDDLITRCRSWLAADRDLDVARAVTFALLVQSMPLPEPDLDLLGELLVEAGLDPSVLDLVTVADDDAMPIYRFVADRKDVEAVARRTEVPEDRPQALIEVCPAADVVDAAVVTAAEAAPAILALWRAWRLPEGGSPWPPPRRVFVVEIATNEQVEVANVLQQTLVSAGETDPQVEVYQTGADVPTYQNLARANGALLWARTAEPAVRVAALFPTGDHVGMPAERTDRHLDHDERDRLLDYLRRGAAMLMTEARTEDVVDRRRGAVVPMSFRTDGEFIWTDAVAYYLAEYGMRPDSELVAHIRERDYRCSTVDGAGLRRALTALQEWSVAGTD